MTERERVRIVYKEAQGYRIVAPTAFGGGPAPHGQLVLHAILEYGGPPDTTFHEVTPENQIGKEIEREPKERRLYREMQVGLLLTPVTGVLLLQWLQANLPKIKAAQPQPPTRAQS